MKLSRVAVWTGDIAGHEIYLTHLHDDIFVAFKQDNHDIVFIGSPRKMTKSYERILAINPYNDGVNSVEMEEYKVF
ncbi:MAG: hypothetical protein PHT07_21555 [Paludibacter sp.]|nr:hypothetical protein [Paludibacter sp.]